MSDRNEIVSRVTAALEGKPAPVAIRNARKVDARGERRGYWVVSDAAGVIVAAGTGEETFEGEFIFGAVCNSTSTGGLMKLDPERVVLDDGKFEMLLVPSPKTAADLQNLVLALLNQQYDSQGLVFRHVSSLRLETEEELPWSLDGEYAPSVPVVDIVNRQRALRMLL